MVNSQIDSWIQKEESEMSNTALENPISLRTFLMAIRTIHWVGITFENIGFPVNIIELFKEAEACLTDSTSNSLLYEKMNPGIETEIDAYHQREAKIRHNQPLSKSRQDRLWTEHKNKREAAEAVKVCSATIKEIVRVCKKHDPDNQAIGIVGKISQKLAEWERIIQKEAPNGLEFLNNLDDLK